LETDFLDQVRFVTVESTDPGDRPLDEILGGYRLDTVPATEEPAVVEELGRHEIVVLVADLQARGIDTFGLVKRIKRQKRYVPVILVTELEGANLAAAVTELHVGHYVPKPVDPDRLMAEVAKCTGYLHERLERERMAAEERAVGALLRLSLRPTTLQEYLQAALELLLQSVTWLKILPRGAIFLAREGEGGDYLHMVAQYQLSPELHGLCARVEFGQCLCGRAAESKEIQFAACVDHRHEIRSEGIQPHGHYNVPLLHEGRAIGVIVFYLPHGHQPLFHEEALLRRVADTLSMGIIRRTQSTALKEAVNAASQAVGQLESITRNLSGIIFRRIDHPDGRVEYPYISSSDKELGFFPSRLLKEGLLEGFELVHQADRKAVRDAMARAAEKMAPMSMDFRLLLENGDTRWMHCSAYPTRLDDGAIRWDGLLLDVEDRKSLEAQLVQSQKLEAVGQLAAGIAHEINTPTQYVSDNTHFLKESFEELFGLIGEYRGLVGVAQEGIPDSELIERILRLEEEVDLEYLEEEIPQALEQAMEGLGKIATIVRAMKEFSHPGSEDREAIDVNKLLANTVTISRNEWKYVAEVEMELEEGLPPVMGFSNQLGQVFLNLIVNAAHAIAGVGGEKLDVEGRIRVSTRLVGRELEVRIEDNGPGIPEELRDKVFNPFFTTKEVGKGTGQGLAIAHDIVKKHDGVLSLEDAPGHGAIFIIRLPVAGLGAEAAA